MSDFLLDCNHLSAAIRKVSPFRDRVGQERMAGHRFVTCIPVLCELEAGILNTGNPPEYYGRLRRMMKFVRVWPLEMPIVKIYADAFHEVRGQGRVLSQVDLILVSMARHRKCTLLTSDRDFEAISNLSIENWVS